MTDPTKSSKAKAPSGNAGGASGADKQALSSFLADRDVPCPFCKANLRGAKANTCPACGFEITLGLLKNTKPAGAHVLLWAVRGLSLIAMSIAAYLAYNSITNAQPAGCGPEGGCGEVLSSRWAKLFGVPVSVPAMLVYAGILIGTCFVGPTRKDSTRRDAWLVLIVLALFAGLGAIWFIGLQLFEINAICPYCMVDHACGLTAAVLLIIRAPLGKNMANIKPPRSSFAMVMTVAVFGMFVALQIRFPTPTAIVDLGDGPSPVPGTYPGTNGGKDAGKDTGKDGRPSLPAAVRIESVKDPSVVDLKNQIWLKLPNGPPPEGYVVLPRRELPVRGSYDAKHLFVVLADYTCPHCKHLHDELDALFKRYGEDQVSFLILPMPFNSKCNFLVRRTNPRHEDACELAAAALTVWRADPSKFAAYDDWLFGDSSARTTTEAIKKAVEILGKERYLEVEKDPWIKAQIQRDVVLYDLSNTQGNQRIPRLMYQKLVISGPPNAGQLIRILEENVGLKPLNP